MNLFPATITAERISVLIDGKFRSFPLTGTDPLASRGRALIDALKKAPQDGDEIRLIADVAAYLVKMSFGRVQITIQDRIILDGRVIDYGLTSRLVEMVDQGFDVSPLVAFLERVDRNPDKSVAQDLYAFIIEGGLPITPDGKFYAFKGVDQDYKSFHTGQELWISEKTVLDHTLESHEIVVEVHEPGKVTHLPGTTISLDRDLCDPNRNATCSRGLHACSHGYLPKWYADTQRVIIVEIDPEDVTAIPNDTGKQKLRCCKMRIVSELDTEDKPETHFGKVVDARYAEPKHETKLPAGPPSQDSFKEGRADGTLRAKGIGLDQNASNRGLFAPFTSERGGRFRKNSAISQAHGIAYLRGYALGFAETFRDRPFPSERAQKLGVDEATTQAKLHRDLGGRDNYSPNYARGGSWHKIPDEARIDYERAYIVAYVKTWCGID